MYRPSVESDCAGKTKPCQSSVALPAWVRATAADTTIRLWAVWCRGYTKWLPDHSPLSLCSFIFYKWGINYCLQKKMRKLHLEDKSTVVVAPLRVSGKKDQKKKVGGGLGWFGRAGKVNKTQFNIFFLQLTKPHRNNYSYKFPNWRVMNVFAVVVYV